MTDSLRNMFYFQVIELRFAEALFSFNFTIVAVSSEETKSIISM